MILQPIVDPDAAKIAALDRAIAVFDGKQANGDRIVELARTFETYLRDRSQPSEQSDGEIALEAQAYLDSTEFQNRLAHAEHASSVRFWSHGFFRSMAQRFLAEGGAADALAEVQHMMDDEVERLVCDRLWANLRADGIPANELIDRYTTTPSKSKRQA